MSDYSEESLLKMGYKKFEESRCYGTTMYQELRREMNPFLWAYFELYQKFSIEKAKREKAESNEAHYRERYLSVASSVEQITVLAKERGIMPGSIKQ